MHLWNVSAVASELSAGNMSEIEKLKYVLFGTVVQMVFASPGVLYLTGQPIALLLYVLWLAIAVIGLVSCFRTNQAGDGRHFIERLVCLGAPLSLRWFLLMYGALLVLAVAWRSIGDESDAPLAWGGPIYVIFTVPLYILYYWWLRRYIRQAASASPLTHEA